MATMHIPSGAIRRRIRQVADLRARASKGATTPASDSLLEQALEVCDDLVRDLAGAELEGDRLRQAVDSERQVWEQLFAAIPVAAIVTGSAGIIEYANSAAAALLHVSATQLRDRELLVYSEDRQAFTDVLFRLSRGTNEVRTKMVLRPRDRKSVTVDAIVVSLSSGDPVTWVWFFTVGSARTETTGAREMGGQSRPSPEPDALEHSMSR